MSLSKGGRFVSCDTNGSDEGRVESGRLRGLFDLSIHFCFGGEFRSHFGSSLRFSYLISANDSSQIRDETRSQPGIKLTRTIVATSVTKFVTVEVKVLPSVVKVSISLVRRKKVSSSETVLEGYNNKFHTSV